MSKNGEEVRDRTTHLVCYSIDDLSAGRYPGTRVKTENQFGRGELVVYGAETLCLPSKKEVVRR